jgi:hypothetical protein
MKVRSVRVSDSDIHFVYNCPGCGYEHAFSPSVHQFNGDLENPTVSPSLLQDNPQHFRVCHSYIKNGMIQFLDDCWHNLKGKTVELKHYDPEFLKSLE